MNRYKVTFNTGPNNYRPTQFCNITFPTLEDMIAYATKWETDPPLFQWNIQSIEMIEIISNNGPEDHEERCYLAEL